MDENEKSVSVAPEELDAQSETLAELTSFQLFSVRFTAVVLIFCGVSGLLEMLTDYINSGLRIEVFFIWFGFGLLRLVEQARWWTVFWSWVILGVIVLIAVLTPFGELLVDEEIYNIVLVALFTLWCICVLNNKFLKPYFTEKGRAEPVWPWVILVFCLALSLFIYAKDAEHARTIKAMRHTEVTLKVLDSISGHPLNINVVQTNPLNDSIESRLKYSFIDGGAEVSWLGTQGRAVTVSSEGYNEVELELTHADNDTEKIIKLELELKGVKNDADLDLLE